MDLGFDKCPSLKLNRNPKKNRKKTKGIIFNTKVVSFSMERDLEIQLFTKLLFFFSGEEGGSCRGSLFN